tara:strand:+ start:473 stop:1402 length:930 start_codon:yes stop_codon:yes gene_type:complete
MQKKYLNFINQKLQNKIKKLNDFLIYGQNINTGTFISGLTKNFKTKKNTFLINTPNSESSLIGMGFGIMMKNKSAIYFGKQLDFLLLGIDHFVNTFNQIKVSKPKLGCFTIFIYVCDQGYQGPQSSFNSFSDLSSMCGINTYQLNTLFDVQNIIKKKLDAKGFKIIGISSKLCGRNILELKPIEYSKNLKTIKYLNGTFLTIVAFNFSLNQGNKVSNHLKKLNKSSDLFHINYSCDNNYSEIIKSVKKTRKILIIDDSKSVNLEAYKLLNKLKYKNIKFKSYVEKRSNISWEVQDDLFKIDVVKVLTKF